MKTPTEMKLFFPDACWRADMISGALFLYFRQEKITLPLHPSVSAFSTGINAFEFFEFVATRDPEWSSKLSVFRDIWTRYQSSLRDTNEILKPLHESSFNTVMFSYPRGRHAWDSAEDLIASSDLPFRDVASLIDPFSASDELFAHIFFEKALELYGGSRTQEGLVAIGREKATTERFGVRKVDWQPLYEYVEQLFRDRELEEILTVAYMFRLPLLQAIPSVLLSNPSLVRFLSSLPVETKLINCEKPSVDLDVIGWEFFRQLLSPKIDPLTSDTVALVQRLLGKHTREVDALGRKCLSLAADLSNEASLESLQRRVGQHIRANVEREIEELLSLNKTTVREFLDSVFEDSKAWIGIGTFIFSLMHGGPIVTAGSAIGTIATVGGKAMKAAAQRRKKLEASDYTALYRIGTSNS